jgi:hypothetical protein
MWTDMLRMTTTQWEPWDYSSVFLGHGICQDDVFWMVCSMDVE